MVALADHFAVKGEDKVHACVTSQVFCRLINSFVASIVLGVDGVVPQ